MKVVYEQVHEMEEESAHIRAVKKTSTIQSAIDLLKNGDGVIWCRHQNEIIRIPMHQIYYVESVDKHTYVYLMNTWYETKYRLYELEDVLDPLFARCSKAMIINLRKVKQVQYEMGGRMRAELFNGEEVIISRSYVKEIKRRLDL